MNSEHSSACFTITWRLGAFSALLMGTLALGPAVHRHTAAPLPLLGAIVTSYTATQPGTPLRPLALHWSVGTRWREVKRAREKSDADFEREGAKGKRRWKTKKRRWAQQNMLHVEIRRRTNTSEACGFSKNSNKHKTVPESVKVSVCYEIADYKFPCSFFKRVHQKFNTFSDRYCVQHCCISSFGITPLMWSQCFCTMRSI